VVYFTETFPWVLLFALLIQALYTSERVSVVHGVYGLWNLLCKQQQDVIPVSA